MYDPFSFLESSLCRIYANYSASWKSLMPLPRFRSVGLSSQREVSPYTSDVIGVIEEGYLFRLDISWKE
jgi:hypothetical protein